MPLVSSAWRVEGEVELLSSSPLSDQEAARKLGRFLEHEQFDTATQAVSATIKLGQLPGVLKVLQQDWQSGSAQCFVDVKARLLVHLHPCFLGDKLHSGLRRAACELLLRFSQTLGCMPLTYEDLQPLGPHGAIVGEHPWVHFLAEFRCVGLAPQVGQALPARVGPLQSKHGISFLILHTIHGFVPKKRLPRGVTFDASRGVWLSGGTPLTEDGVTPFQVCSVNSGSHDLSLIGELVQTSVEPVATLEDAKQQEAPAQKTKRRKESSQVPVKAEETEDTAKKRRKTAKPV
jgi:hypothetical protein